MTYSEVASSHCPRKSDFRNQTIEHNGEDDATQARSGCNDTVGETSSPAEPGGDTVDGWREETTDTNRATDALRKQDLIVLLQSR